MFFVYDRLVERRQRLILTNAQRTSTIVSSLFVSFLESTGFMWDYEARLSVLLFLLHVAENLS